MSAPPTAAVSISGLRKSFQLKGKTLEAVSGIDLTVATGEIFGLLGPNGAGKTTTLRILTTLLPADAGTAYVAGADVRRNPALVRRRIGYVGQLGGADASATGRENLLLAGRLYGLSAVAASRRCDELAAAFGLSDFADRAVRTYSGGQRRRLEVTLGIMHKPQVLFLDEPTTGLDPQNRANLWTHLRSLRDEGTTVFLTTHYLDEADQLSDRVAIVDHGRVIALGTPGELKRRYSADTISVTPDLDPSSLPEVSRVLSDAVSAREAAIEHAAIRLTVADTRKAMLTVIGVLAARGVSLLAASVGRTSLDDVFLRETGRSLRDAAASADDPSVAAAPSEEVAA